MKCQQCLQTIDTWHTYCPNCQANLQNLSYSVITNAVPESKEQEKRRLLWRNVLQLSSLALIIIVIASIFRFSPPKANTPEKTLATARVVLSPAPTPTPEPTVAQAIIEVHSPTPTVEPEKPMPGQNGRPVGIFPEELVAQAMPRKNSQILSARPAPLPVTGHREKKAERALPASPPTPVPTDEAPPKKLAQLMKTASVSPRSTETEARIDVETGNVSLNPNTGLLMINSYIPARVYIDGVFSGTTPRNVKLISGEHVVMLLADGYQEYSRKVKVMGQQKMGLLASLSKK